MFLFIDENMENVLNAAQNGWSLMFSSPSLDVVGGAWRLTTP